MPRNDELLSRLKWGLEVEITGGTRRFAAQVISRHFGTSFVHVGGSYDKYSIHTPDGNWSVLYDSSITPLKKSDGRVVTASNEYKVEVTTPPLTGEQAIDDFQKVIRALRDAGFFPSSTCGCHIHVEIKSLDVKALVHLCNQIHSKQDLLYRALGVSEESLRYRYCAKLPTNLVENLKKKKPATLEEFADVWYTTLSSRSGMHEHYDMSRYHILNLTRGLVSSSRFYLGTAEFRCFSTPKNLHAGKLRAYIQFCLLLVSYCSDIKKSSYKPVVIHEGESMAYKLRCFFLKLGCIGEKYKTMRLHWLDNFGNESRAWRRNDRI